MDNAGETPQDATAQEIRGIAAKAIRNGMDTCVNLLTNEILRAMYTPEVMQYLGDGIIGYIAAAGALAFSAKEITPDGITALIRAAGQEPKEQYLRAVTMLQYKNELVYINAIYFIKANGKEPTIDLVAEMVRAMGIPPDHRIAGYAIEYSREYLSGAYNFVSERLNQGGTDEKFFKKLYLGMLNLAGDLSGLAVSELGNTIEAASERAKLTPEALPYITAIGSLAFAGQEMSTDKVKSMIAALGMQASEQMLKAFAPIRFKNPIVYLIALYYLYSMDLTLDVDSTCRVVVAMGIAPDTVMAEGVLAYYKSKGAEHI